MNESGDQTTRIEAGLRMPNPPRLPWPRDVVIVVCARPAEFRRKEIRGEAIGGQCGDCGTALLADSFTIERARHMPQRRGRPLKLVCLDCAGRYDFGNVTYCEDHRGGKTVIQQKRGPQ